MVEGMQSDSVTDELKSEMEVKCLMGNFFFFFEQEKTYRVCDVTSHLVFQLHHEIFNKNLSGGASVTNLPSNHEDECSKPGLAQWVEDPVLP